ncbi:50S ribosomal protein L19e [Candidatus Micrarchaeota archaeon]|nr:50S ribosomal protein L19e [Candidatus Micrarchaeota archaeon]
MSVRTVRRMAADILGVGVSKVRFKPEEMGKVSEALTRDDVRALIKENIIYAVEKKGVSRARAKQRARQRKKGRQKGPGNVKGGRKGLRKKLWMARVRLQRAVLRRLYSEGLISSIDRRRVYYMIKGGHFRSKRALVQYLKDNGLVTDPEKVDEIVKKRIRRKVKKKESVKKTEDKERKVAENKEKKTKGKGKDNTGTSKKEKKT